MTRRTKRRLIAAVVLSLLLALLTVLYVNYRATRQLGLQISVDSTAILDPPTYLYSFAGPDADRLVEPIGVLVDGNRCYVADGRRGRVDIFTLEGQRVGQFPKGKLVTPLYIAKNPVNGQIYVSDRRKHSIEVFTPQGTWIRTFDPHLPKNQLPKIDTHGIPWAPVALTFKQDGTMYVTDILKGHRFLIFDPAGKFKKSVGDAGLVEKADKGQELFQFPNSIKVVGDELWVADSNNRRIQIFTLDGEFKRILATSGLPRGVTIIPKTPNAGPKTPTRLAIVDTLAQDVTIFDATGKKLVGFGTAGVMEGQFSYPTDTSSDGAGRIFITDTSNGRVQVWGWPTIAAPVPLPRTPSQWAWCLSPLLLLPLLLLGRKRDFLATPDFVLAMNQADQVDLMPGGRRRWLAWEKTFGEIQALETTAGKRLTEVVEFEPSGHSDSDARALMQRLELSYDEAAVLALAQSAKVFCTEDPELRRVAKMLEIDVCNAQEYRERFAQKRGEKAAAGE